MGVIKIEILNPKALKIIKGLQDLDLIRINSGILQPEKKKARKDWNNQIKSAIAKDDLPDIDPIEKITNDWDNTEWTWPIGFRYQVVGKR